MNKISKYRSWDKIERNMCYGNEEEAVSWHSGAISPAIVVINSLLKERRERYEYMQYIGIDDKDGKEIYDGDIVKIHQFLFDGCEYEKEIIVSIEYMDEMACFGANLLHAKEIRRYMGYGGETDSDEKVVVPLCNFYGLHEESFEVIGNVYENADLLKEAGNE